MNGDYAYKTIKNKKINSIQIIVSGKQSYLGNSKDSFLDRSNNF